MPFLPISARMTGLFGMITAVGTASAAPEAIDPATAIACWQQARAWVTDASLPALGNPANGVEGVHVVLRHGRRPIATALATKWNNQTPPLQTAVGKVLSKALHSDMLRGLGSDLQKTSLASLALEVEVAGPLSPITSPSLREAAQELHPALDGLALRVGRRWEVRFPSYLRLTGDGATLTELESLAMAVQLTPAQLDAARRRGQATLYRFQTIDLVERWPNGPVELFVRGEESAPIDVTQDSLVALGDRVAQRLARQRVVPENTSGDDTPFLQGDYDAAAGRHNMVAAPDRDHYLAAIALQRWLTARGERDVVLEEAMHDFATQPDAASREQPIDLAMQSVARVEGLNQTDTVDPEALQSVVLDRTLNLTTRSIAAWGLHDHPEVIATLLNDAASAEPTALFNALPWLGWVDQRHAASTGTGMVLGSPWSKIEHMLIDRQRHGGPLGGALAVKGDTASISAHMLRPLTFYVGWTNQSAPWTHHAMAFVSTLIVPSDDQLMRGEDAPDGIRMAPWDERMPIWAQAFTLLCLSEALANESDGPGLEATTP